MRAGLTETINAYPDMPGTVAELPALRDKLDDVRRANLDHHVELIGEAAARGVEVLCLGELFAAPYFALHEDPMWRELAEDPDDGPTVRAMRAAADRHRIALVAPIYELDSATGRRFNTAIVIDAAGELLGKCRKIHIPHGANEQGSFHEGFYFEPSDGQPTDDGPDWFPVFSLPGCNLGVATCYDRHFEGVVSSLASRGADLVFSPAVTFGAKSRRMWPLEFAVDAARHGVIIGGSNRRGAEPPWNQDYFGESHFCGPNGALENRSDHPELVIADLDIASPGTPDPSGWDLRRDARPDIYGA